MIVILYLISGIQSTPTTDITMITIVIIVVVVVFMVLVLIAGILSSDLLCVVYFKKRCYKLKGTLSYC